jgi:hypothetical protein
MVGEPRSKIDGLTDVIAAGRIALQDVELVGHAGELVEPMGFEPTTSSMPSRRAPNCATAPRSDRNLIASNGEGVKPAMAQREAHLIGGKQSV